MSGAVRDLGRVLVQIPARGGSKRVPAKNLRLLAGQPMIAYAIGCALANASRLAGVLVNTDDDRIEQAARHHGADVYRRPAALGADDATGDDFTADFIAKLAPDTVVMVNPACPLVDAEDFGAALALYAASDADTLITCQKTQMQVFCDERPVNISVDEPLRPTQHNPVVKILNFAVTIWDAATFVRNYERNRTGYLGTRRILMPIDPLHGLKVSDEADFRAAERILLAGKSIPPAAAYWPAG